jgi:hypothetical protein
VVSLPNFPVITQRDSDVNALWDCVPACIAMGMQYLTGGETYTAAGVKTAVLGANYTGTTSASDFIKYCSGRQVKLFPVAGAGDELLNVTYLALSSGYPVIMTEPDPYDPAPGNSHVVIAVSYIRNALTVIDPFIAAKVTKTVNAWSSLLLYNQIWVMRNMIPKGWSDNGTKLVAPNGHSVVLGFRDYILNNGWLADNYPLGEESGANPVLASNTSLGAGTRQTFMYSELVYTPERGVINAPIGQELAEVRFDLASASGTSSASAQQKTEIQQVITMLQSLL